MTSRFRGPSAVKDGPKETTFLKEHFHLEPDVHAGKSFRNGSRDNHYHFGMNERIDSNGHDSRDDSGSVDPDALYQRSKEQFASWDIKDIAQENRSKQSKKSQDDRQDNSRVRNGKSKIDIGKSDKQSKDLQDKRSDLRDEGYVGSLTREDRSSFDREYASSRSRKKEPWEEKKKSRSIKIDRASEDKSESLSPVDRRDQLLREIENLTIDNGSSPERRIRAMIERFKTREESKKSRLENRRSPSKEKEEQEKTKSGRTDPPDDRADRSRIQWNDQPDDRRPAKTRLTDADRTERRSRSREKSEEPVDKDDEARRRYVRRRESLDRLTDRRSHSKETDEQRDAEGDARKNDSLRKRSELRGRGSVDRSVDRRRNEEITSYDKEDEFKKNDSLRFRSLDRDESRRHEEGGKRSDNARRRSKEMDEDRPRVRDSSKRRSYALDGSPEDFDVRIQRYERAEPRRDHDFTRKSTYRDSEPSRKDSFKDHDRDTAKKGFFKSVDSSKKNSPTDRDSGLIRKTSFKEQDNDIRRKNSFKSHLDANHKYLARDGDNDLARKNSFKEQNAEVSRRISFKSQISIKNQDDELLRRNSPRNYGGSCSRISFKEDDDADRKYSVRPQDHKRSDDDVSRKNSFKEPTVEFGSVTYKEPETFGRKNSREEFRNKSPQNRYVEFGGTFYKSDEDEDYRNQDLLGRKSPKGQVSSRSKGREAIDRRSDRHSKALTPPRRGELDPQEETKDRKAFCSKSWHESNRLFAVKYLHDNSKIHNDPEEHPENDRPASPEKILPIQSPLEHIEAADGFDNDIDERFARTSKLEEHRQIKLEDNRFDRAAQSDENRERQAKFGDTRSDRRTRLDGGRLSDVNRGRETESRYSTSHERNGTTVIRIRSGVEDAAVEKRRRRRPQDVYAGRRRRYSVEDGAEVKPGEDEDEDRKVEEAEEEEEEEMMVAMAVDDNDEDDEEDDRRRQRIRRADGALVAAHRRGAGSTPSRRLWNYREGGALITDIDDGQPCLQCGETCPGFSAHAWRKNCTSCKCPREAHDVCHEEWVSVRSRLGLKGDEQSGPIGFDPRKRGLAWAPPGLPPDKVAEYFSVLPEINVPRLGTPGERHRDRQLAIQLPKQDLARAYCRHLDPQHASSADDFMAARNEIALDIGSVQEVVERDLDCGTCLARLEPGILAVSVSKLGFMCHPTCFYCTECHELLVDLAYCVHDDALFCERHYAEQLKPRCAACDELIFSGEYTKAMNKDWHSGHFCCWQCDESLTGQRYVLRDEHPYCIKCYESVFANGCEECNKIIGIDSKDLSYKDKHWHEACFLCNKCRVSLVDKQFGSKVDKIYCGNCYDTQFASRCDGCGEIFRAGTKKMEYKTRQWHEKCFCCVVCKNPIGTKSFIPREQEIYCAGCYEDKFATRCVKCNKIITSGGVTYKNEPWHRDCFTCSNCNNSLAGQRFTSRDDKPYCADCFGELFAKRCTACSKPITGIGGTRFISFEDRHWHNDCFICAGCKTSLVGRGFITDADDIICPECAKQKLM